MPKTVLPPTAKLSFTRAVLKLFIILTISSMFNPTNKEVMIRREKSSILNAEYDPIKSWNSILTLKSKGYWPKILAKTSL